MTAANQLYWETADWWKLSDFIANPDNYPAGIDLTDHRYFEDLRKRIWLLDHIGAGSSDGSELEWTQPAEPAAGDKFKRIYPGSKIVTTYDTRYGWLYWTIRDSGVTQYNWWQSPPLIDNGVHIDIHPEDNVWITEFGVWELMPSPHKYYQWSENRAALEFASESSYGNQNDGSFTICNPKRPGHLFYPRHTDPKEQYPILYYKDTQTNGYQYREKVGINRRYITQPDTLGAVFTSFRYGPSNQGTPPYPAVIKDPWLQKSIGSMSGNQYANKLNAPERPGNNSPGQGGSGSLFYGRWPDKLPQSGLEMHSVAFGNAVEWSFNPKVNYAYQNRIEVTLCSGIYTAADSAYGVNFNDKYNETDSNVNTNYDGAPLADDELFGENASGFELYLAKSGSYDRYFDTYKINQNRYNQTAFWPPAIIEYISEQVLNGGGPRDNWQDAWTDYDLAIAGTWRKTWKYSMGRVSSFMRSFEMGEPANIRDSWDPDVTYWNKATTGKGDWYGARTRIYPNITEFDDKSKNISTHIDDYEFIVAANRGRQSFLATELKVGYLVHFVDSLTQKIFDGTNFIPSGYVTKIANRPDGRPGHVIRTTFNSKDYKIMTWNQEISERHDPVSLDFKDSVLYPGYELNPLLLQEMHEILKLQMYRTISVYTNTIGQVWGGDTYAIRPPPLWSDSFPEAFSESRYATDSGKGTWVWPWIDWFDWDDIDTWLDSASGQIGNQSTAISGWGGATGITHRGIASRSEDAYQLTASDKDIAALHGRIIMKFETYHSDPTGKGAVAVTLGGGVLDITVPVDAVHRFYSISMSVQKTTIANVWAIIHSADRWTDDGVWESYPAHPPVPALAGFFQKKKAMVIANASYPPRVVFNWENIPASVFTRSDLLHVDVEVAPFIDTKPPKPNPPLFHTDPQAYFVYIPESGTIGQPDYIPEHVELWVKADSILCEDLEGSDPVKYHMIEKIAGLDSYYDTNRWNYIKIRDLTMIEVQGSTFNLEAGTTIAGVGTATRITYSMSFALNVGENIRLANTDEGTLDGDWPLTAATDAYFEFDMGHYEERTIPSGATIKLIDGYGELDWAYEAAKNYEFALQAKDSMTPVANAGKVGKYLKPATPEQWPMELIPATF